MLLAPPFAPKITTAIYKKYIKAYYLIFRLLFIIISVEISRGRTTLPKLFLSTLKKQSLCAVLSRSCSTSNEQRTPRVQSIRLWAAARSTARFLSSVPKSTFRNNCGRFVKGGRAKGKSIESERINRHPDNIRIQIGKHYRSICDHDAYVTAEKGQERLAGYGRTIPRTLAEVFEHDTNDLFKRIGVDRSESTWWRYRAVLGHLRAFLKHEYNLHHIPLLELEQSFIEQYHVYLKTVCRSKAGSVCRYMDRWNNVVKISFENGLMPRNSFALCRYSAPREPRTFLSEKELRIFQTTRLKSAKHEYHRDLFLFSRFTEICYKDMRYLTCEQIIPDTKGHLRIHGNRCKTGGEYTIKFLPAALRLLEKYRGTAPRRLHSICRDLAVSIAPCVVLPNSAVSHGT